MLKGELYDIVSLTPETAQIRINPSSVVYAAHFPGFPITPGVVIVKIAVELAGMVLNRKVDVVSAKNIKFLSPVIPDSDTTLLFKFPEQGSVSVYKGETLCATMSIGLN